jgi:hypothetical protein
VLQHRSTSVPAEPRSISDRPTGFAVRLVIGSLALCVLTGCSQVTRDAVDRQVDHGMTSDEVMTARRVALARALREHVSVKARVTAGEGTVPASAAIHHKACESGPLLTITLRGNFPQSPSAHEIDDTGTRLGSEVLIVDAESGTVCSDTFHAGITPADPDAVSLFSN